MLANTFSYEMKNEALILLWILLYCLPEMCSEAKVSELLWWMN